MKINTDHAVCGQLIYIDQTEVQLKPYLSILLEVEQPVYTKMLTHKFLTLLCLSKSSASLAQLPEVVRAPPIGQLYTAEL